MPARAKKTPVGLSHERIRREALRLIDEEGIDAFSTRKLGRALGCEAMAIYWYYPSKEALLDAVVEALVSGLVVPRRPPHDWIEAMRDVAHAYRKLAHDHPKAFPLLATRRFATVGTYAFLEQLFALAREQGIPDRTTAYFYRVVSGYCSGIALNEIAERTEPERGDGEGLAPRFPSVAGVMAWLEPKHDADVFRFGLDILLDALAKEAPSGARRRR